MVLNLAQTILQSILLNKKVRTTITSKNQEKLQIWKQEIKPYLEELQDKGYIENLKAKIEIKFKIKKPITPTTIEKLQITN